MKIEWTWNFPPGTTCLDTKGQHECRKWLEHFSQYKVPGPCVLIFDGAKCHLDYSIVEEAEKYEVTLYCLPSNTTHELQPMDKSVFHPFEVYPFSFI